MNEHDNKTEIVNAISYPNMHGTTNTADALRYMRETMFRPENGDRPEYQNVAILITDGRSSDREKTFQVGKIPGATKYIFSRALYMANTKMPKTVQNLVNVIIPPSKHGKFTVTLENQIETC